MLLFNLQKKWADVDSLTEHLDVMGMDVYNVYEEQKVSEGIWELNKEATENFFIQHRYVVLVVSEELFLSLSALYYLEVIRRLYNKGKVRVYVINNSISQDSYPLRYKWLVDCVHIKDYDNPVDEKTYAYAMDIVLGVTYDLFANGEGNMCLY